MMQANNTFEVQKLPPQAIELEETVLGAMLLEPHCAETIIPILVPNAFYRESHQTIYKAMFQMHKEGKRIDIATVCNFLHNKKQLEGVGGAYAVTCLTNRVAASDHAEEHARIIRELFIARELIRIGTEAIRRGYNAQDVPGTLDFIRAELDATDYNLGYESPDLSFSDLVDMSVSQAQMREELRKSGKELGIGTGLTDLDKEIVGLQGGDYIVIAARPSMGKTALALSICKHIAKNGHIPAFFSLETTGVKLVNRLLIAESGIDSYRFRQGKMTPDEHQEMNAAAMRLKKLKFWIDDRASMSISRMKSKCRLLQKKKELSAIVIDFLQLMEGEDNNRNREQVVSNISRQIKIMAKEFAVPIIVLVQLSREVEKRGGDKTPFLSDLRESGAIEQDADIVIFPHRPWYYGMEADDAGNSTFGICNLIIAKNKEGDLNTIKVRHNANITEFTDYNHNEFKPLPFGGFGNDQPEKLESEPF